MSPRTFRTTLFATALLLAAGGGLATIDTTAPAAAAPATPAAPLFLDNPPATCHADCLYGKDVSCSGNTCSSADDPGGYVICDGKPKLCPRPPL